MKLSASQAAKETGKSIPTISRAIKSGRLTATKNDTGGYEIDPSELFRVYPPKPSNPDETPTKLGDATLSDNRVLQVEVELLRERLVEKDQMIQDLRVERDSWRQQANNLLTSDKPPVAPPKRSWWPFGQK